MPPWISKGPQARLFLALALCGGFLTLWSLQFWLITYLTNASDNDFHLYYLAGQIGLQHGWGHIYDLGLQSYYNGQLQPTPPAFGPLWYYITPPLAAWIVSPLTLLPMPIAFAIWSAFNVGVLVTATKLAAPTDRLPKIVWILMGFGSWSVAYAFRWGQITLLLLLVIAATWKLLKSDRQVAAGLVLAFVTLKPNIAFLIPVALLVAGYRRAFLSFLVAAGLIAGLSLISLGSSGLDEWRQLLSTVSANFWQRNMTLAVWLHNDYLVWIADGIIGLMALAAAWKYRRHGPELPLAAGILGSLLTTPYLHGQDFALLLAAAWLFSQHSPTRLWAAVLMAVWLSMEFQLIVFANSTVFESWATAPLVVAVIAWLTSMLTARSALPAPAIQPRTA